MGKGLRRSICLALGLLAACGPAYGPGETPRETIRNFEGAMRDLEFGCAYDMMAPAARAQVDRQIEATQVACAAIPEELQERLGLDEFVDATPREALELAGDRARDEAAGQAAELKRLNLAILDIKEYGDRASVKVSLMLGRRETETRLKLVRVNGRWFMENDAAMQQVAPLPTVPVLPAPTFT